LIPKSAFLIPKTKGGKSPLARLPSDKSNDAHLQQQRSPVEASEPDVELHLLHQNVLLLGIHLQLTPNKVNSPSQVCPHGLG
jgi:hypothetical protein